MWHGYPELLRFERAPDLRCDHQIVPVVPALALGQRLRLLEGAEPFERPAELVAVAARTRTAHISQALASHLVVRSSMNLHSGESPLAMSQDRKAPFEI